MDTKQLVGERCDLPGDLSLTDGVDIIRYDRRCVFVNGYLRRTVDPSLESIAEAILEPVLGDVPTALVTPFAEEVISQLGASFVLHSDAVEAWLRARAK